ncbi:hypothetical protein J7E83_20195 [Arthrobacter sp. ISL-48]|uniref:hypothetical protein n=1 Tax=Arthrobacter sp. ISL-48 TaxID=2819110 RepID=UPI001BE868B9|nr:hypothetical protein [Arthrobacter sp. ISL-48]MBT2534406.1 hypothetical protein [Arthrobacter sp. ISL-48]
MTADSQQVLSSQDHALGLKYRRNSIIFGVIGLFVFGVAFGLFAFITARKAEGQGVKATAGKVLGVLGFIGGIIVMTILFKNR